MTNLGRIYFRENLSIKGKTVNLNGDVKVPSSFQDSSKRLSSFIVEADNITVKEGVTIESGFQLLHANSTLEIM